MEELFNILDGGELLQGNKIKALWQVHNAALVDNFFIQYKLISQRYFSYSSRLVPLSL